MSKKRIIAIVTIIVLLFAAGISVGVFLYGRGETQATDGNETVNPNQPDGGTSILPDNNGTQTGEGDGQEANPNAGNESSDGNAENIANTDNNDGDGNVGNAGNAGNAGVTTNPDVEQVGETTITRVEEQEKLVSKAFWDWWKPMEVAITPSDIGVQIPQIVVKKAAITGVGGDQFVYAGQDITYVIAVTNNSETDVENIEVTDKIPQKTTFVSIEDAYILKNIDGELSSEVIGTKTTVGTDNIVGVKWVISIPAGETVIARFTVNVNNGAIGTILNTAIANGEESNEVQTSIIRTQKSSVVTRIDEIVETAKIGDLIAYTISIENTGDVEGTTYVIDEVPTGTQFVSAQEGARVTKSVDTSIIWSVTIPAHTTITREFTVEVTSVEGLIKNIADVGGTTTNEDIIDTANIDVVKTATAINREAITENNPLQPVKVGDKIEYTIVVTNTGSRDLTNVLLEEQLEGVKVTKLVVDNVEKAIEKDVETGKLIIGDLKAAKEATEETESVEAGVAVITAEYVVTYDVDIKGKGNEDGTTIPVYNKVIVTGETVTNPEDPNEVPEKVEDNDDETVPVAEDPRFEVVKTAVAVKRVGEDEFNAISGKVAPGDIVKYEIVVTNTGNTTLTNIEVTDTLKVRIDSEDGELKEANTETGISTLKTIPSLVAGAKETIVTYYEVNQNDMTTDEKQIEIIRNIVTAKTEELDEKQDDEIVPVNPYITRDVTKTWLGDEDNKYATRPAHITVKLYDDAELIDTVQITQAKNWSHEFTMLPKYNEDGTIIVYTITEDDVSYYDESVPTTDMQEYTITNTLNQEKISVPVTKTWVDNYNKYNTRPSQITVRLWADGREVQVATITAASVDQNGKWNYEFTNLPRYNGQQKEIVYTITEDAIADYDESIVGYNITNTLNPIEPTSISGKKTWIDNGNAYRTRPPQITVNLLINESIVNTQVVTPDGNGNWKYSFTNLPTKDMNGNAITYSIQELSVPNYTSEIIGTNIKNTIAQQKTSVEGTKTWIVPQGTTLPTVTVKLFRNGSQVATTTINNETGKYSFPNLDKYDLTTGKEYIYTVEEVVPSGYTQVANDGPNFTNQINQEYITLSGEKKWYVPSSVTIPAITVRVYQNGSQYVVNGTEVKTKLQPGTTTYSFGELPKYTFTTLSNGLIRCTINEYKVVEDKLTGFKEPIYSSIIKNDNNWVQNITNKWAQEYITITVNKNWRDLGVASERPTIYFDLYKKVGNEAEAKVATLTLNNTKISGQFARQEKYTISQDGRIYTLNKYRVEERVVSKYTSSGPSVTTPITSDTTVSFTNTINQEYISISGTKIWDTSGMKPKTTQIEIYAWLNGDDGKPKTKTDKYDVVTYNKNGSGAYIIGELPKYKTNADGTIFFNSAGKAVLNTYTPIEKEYSEFITEQDGNTITNKPKVIVEKKTTKIVTTTQNSPVDVVFVLDVSTSMKSNYSANGKTRVENMVNAVNSAISTIMAKPNNRVGIVAFSSDVKDVKTATLQNLQNNSNATLSYNGTTVTGVNGSITVAGATYTQTGIEKGAQMLINASNKTNRTPILVILTDGEPTYYNPIEYTSTNEADNIIGSKAGTSDAKSRGGATGAGYDTTPQNVYYTILAANYWKQRIAEEYGVANVYTVGMDMTSKAASAVLDPTKSNIEGYTCSYSVATKYNLNKIFTDAGRNTSQYDYSNGTLMVSSKDDWNNFHAKLNSFVYTNSQTVGEDKTREISEVSTTNTVTLTNVETSKNIKITYSGGDYTQHNAPSGAVVPSGTGYIIYLNKLSNSTNKQVTISYYKKQ